MADKIGMVSLGCPKNQVDAEIMLAKLEDISRRYSMNYRRLMRLSVSARMTIL